MNNDKNPQNGLIFKVSSYSMTPRTLEYFFPEIIKNIKKSLTNLASF